MGRLEEALDDLNEAIYLQQDNSTFYYSRGIVFSKMDRFREAVEDYSKAITLTKDKEGREMNERFQALYNRGNCYRRLNELELSIEDLIEAIKINGTDPHAKNNLGLSYLDNRDFD
jgi:tetratricopeptide (TPR) repeat protein